MFVGPIVLDKCKISWSSLNRFRDIPPEAVGGDIFDSFFALTSDQKYNDVISGVTVDNVGVDVRVKFDNSRLNGLWGMNEQDEAYPNSVSPKNECSLYFGRCHTSYSPQ